MAGPASSTACATCLVLAALVAATTASVPDASAQDIVKAKGKMAWSAMKQSTGTPSSLVGPDDLLTYWVYPDVGTMVDADTEYDPETCESISSGTWAITAKPKNGTTAFVTLDGNLANGACPGVSFPFATIYYTWTSTSKTAVKDTFKAKWTTPDSVVEDSYAIDVGYLKINLVSPPANNHYVITATPTFPAIKATAQVMNVLPDPTSTTQFTWTEKLSVTKGTGQTVSYANHLRQSQTTSGTAEYELQRTDDTVLIGGNLELDVAATVNGHALTGSTSGVTIIGTNPQRADIQNRIAATVPTLALYGLTTSDVIDVTERIACQESKQRQFNAAADGGTAKVLISSDNGVGISQLTNPSPFSDPNLLFDWRSNTDKGLSIYGEKIPAAHNFPANLRASTDYQKAVTNVVNPVRVANHLSPIVITPAPNFTKGGVIGSTPPDQLLEDATRGYNGYGVKSYGLYGFYLHEFEPDLTYLEQLPDSQLPGLGTDSKVWARVQAADRDPKGDVDYISHITSASPQCGG